MSPGRWDEHRATLGVEPICRLLQPPRPAGPVSFRDRIKGLLAFDRPVDALRACSAVLRAAESLGPQPVRCRAGRRDQTGLRGEFRGLRSAQDLAAARSRRHRGGPLSMIQGVGERLMRSLGIQGAVRGRAAKTTVSDKAIPCPADRVNRQFQALSPNTPSRVLLTRAALQAAHPPADGRGVSDFTYVSTWQGFAYTAFVMDVFARRPIAGQRGLAGVAHGHARLRPRRLGAGAARPAPGAAGWPDPPQRSLQGLLALSPSAIGSIAC